MRQRHLWCLLLAARAAPAQKVSRQACKPCNPQGATGTEPPPIGPEIDSLFLNVLQSVKDIRFDKRWEDQFIGRENAFCCAENLDCLTVLNLNIPMCYDKFTTHYAFPDGSWGSLTTGEYKDTDGGHANLLTGEYTKPSGEKGDIYSTKPEGKPNTATLSIPPQWTGTGVGTAIPPTEIASVVTDPPAQTSMDPTTTAADVGAESTESAAATSSSETGAAVPVSTRADVCAVVSLLGAVTYLLLGT